MKRAWIAFSCLIWVCMMPNSAAAFGPVNVEFSPPYPLTTDVIEITISGLWENTCVPNDIWAAVWGGAIYLNVYVVYPPDVQCAMWITPWELTVSIGPLSEGVYTVLGQIEHAGYEEWGLLTVSLPTGRPTVYICDVAPGSTLCQSGGFIGLMETYDLSGSFRLVHDPNNRRAWLTRVAMTSEPNDFLPTRDVDELLNLSGLEAINVTVGGAQFAGQTVYYPDTPYSFNVDVTAEAVIDGGTIALTAETHAPCCDIFGYSIDVVGAIVDDPVCSAFLDEDSNKDCQVDLFDMEILSAEWTMDLAALSQLAADWLKCNLIPDSACY